jgi:methylthioribose-1-phosphate isomerase
MNLEPILFENDCLKIIDQTRLPDKFIYINLPDLKSVCKAIRSLKIRGAPAIGITAAYGFFVAANALAKKKKLNTDALLSLAEKLIGLRPTAVNLSWAVKRMQDEYKKHSDDTSIEQVVDALRNKAIMIHQEEKAACEKIGESGEKLIPQPANIMTHCNAGILATGGIGTALAPVYKSMGSGKNVHVFVNETRPVGQGARLTYWELNYNKVPCTLITDNMAGWIMKSKKIDLVITGADRITANGDTANKIGTYALAILAKYHKVPFYVAAPLSTFDFKIPDGYNIMIEERDKEEITNFWNIKKKRLYKVMNPAFDVTPASLITGYITPAGIFNRIENLTY